MLSSIGRPMSRFTRSKSGSKYSSGVIAVGLLAVAYSRVRSYRMMKSQKISRCMATKCITFTIMLKEQLTPCAFMCCSTVPSRDSRMFLSPLERPKIKEKQPISTQIQFCYECKEKLTITTFKPLPWHFELAADFMLFWKASTIKLYYYYYFISLTLWVLWVSGWGIHGSASISQGYMSERTTLPVLVLVFRWVIQGKIIATLILERYKARSIG